MPTPLQTVDQLQEYFRGVIERSEHHAPAVREVLPLLAGVIVYYKDTGTHLEAYTHGGAIGNVLWVWIGSCRYVLTYDHAGEQVVLKRETLRGEVVAGFDGRTTAVEVNAVFRELAAQGTPPFVF